MCMVCVCLKTLCPAQWNKPTTHPMHGSPLLSTLWLSSSPQVADLIAAGKVKQVVAASFPLEQVEEAHKLSEGGRTRGKIVLTV